MQTHQCCDAEKSPHLPGQQDYGSDEGAVLLTELRRPQMWPYDTNECDWLSQPGDLPPANDDETDGGEFIPC